MKLADFSRKGTEAVTGVVSALRRRRPTELSAVKISQILRCSRFLVRVPGYTLALFLALSLSLQAAYRVHLTSGEVLTADAPPVIKNGEFCFHMEGTLCCLPVDLVDLPKTRADNPPSPKAPDAPEGSRVITNEDLEKIGDRSRLANEQQLSEGRAAGAPNPGMPASVQRRLEDLRVREERLQKRLRQREEELEQKRAEYDSFMEKYKEDERSIDFARYSENTYEYWKERKERTRMSKKQSLDYVQGKVDDIHQEIRDIEDERYILYQQRSEVAPPQSSRSSCGR